MDINRYLNLVPTENARTLTRYIDGEEVQVESNYMKYLEAVLKHMTLLGDTVDSFNLAFDINNAAGNQLDIIGELVGVKRLLPFVPLTGSREMDDDEFRVIILMKIFRNEWDGTMEGAAKAYQSSFRDFAGITFWDDGVCHVNIGIRAESGTRIAEILNSSGVLLVPAGVGKTVSIVDNDIIIEFVFGTAIASARGNVKGYLYDTYSEYYPGNKIVSNVEWRYVRELQPWEIVHDDYNRLRWAQWNNGKWVYKNELVWRIN